MPRPLNKAPLDMAFGFSKNNIHSLGYILYIIYYTLYIIHYILYKVQTHPPHFTGNQEKIRFGGPLFSLSDILLSLSFPTREDTIGLIG